jgi:hypothetical protein
MDERRGLLNVSEAGRLGVHFTDALAGQAGCLPCFACPAWATAEAGNSGSYQPPGR